MEHIPSWLASTLTVQGLAVIAISSALSETSTRERVRSGYKIESSQSWGHVQSLRTISAPVGESDKLNESGNQQLSAPTPRVGHQETKTKEDARYMTMA